jgi:hypothetical protein
VQRGSYCYRLFTTAKSFNDAELACNDEGAQLASVTNKKDFRWLGTGIMW